MKFSEIEQFEGECCPVDLVDGEVNQQLHCIICYQVMTKPVTVSCASGHTFGMACLKDWIKDKEVITCPYCRGPANGWKSLQGLSNSLKTLESKCSSCKNWQGEVTNLQDHKNSCLSYRQQLQKKLDKTIELQIQELQIEINPHLRQAHAEIFQKYVENWSWLKNDLRNWKWWWWCNNPWWENKACIQCNFLWHKYERKIDALQVQRVNIIGTINKKFGKEEKKEEQGMQQQI